MENRTNPAPWHIEGQAIRDANGDVVVSAINPCNMNTRRLIVRAANELAERKPVTDSHGVGNAAAMREALASVRNWCINKLGGASFQVTVEGLLSIVEAALSAPARNCDVGTAKEQNDRFNLQCFRYHTGRCSPHCSTIPAKTESECVLKWAQMPYGAQEGAAHV